MTTETDTDTADSPGVEALADRLDRLERENRALKAAVGDLAGGGDTDTDTGADTDGASPRPDAPEASKRDFLVLTGAVAAGFLASTGVAAADHGVEDFHGTALLIGAEADRPTPGGAFFRDKDAYHYLYLTTDTSSIYRIETGDASWTDLGFGGVWSDSDGDGLVELASEFDGAVVDELGVGGDITPESELDVFGDIRVRPTAAGHLGDERFAIEVLEDENNTGRTAPYLHTTADNGRLYFGRATSPGQDIELVFQHVRGFRDMPDGLNFNNNSQQKFSFATNGSWVWDMNNTEVLPSLPTRDHSGTRGFFTFRPNHDPGAGVTGRGVEIDTTVTRTKDRILGILNNGTLEFEVQYDGTPDLHGAPLRGVEVVTSVPSPGDLAAGEIKLGDSTGPNGRDEIFWSTDGSTLAQVEADP